YAQSTSPTSAAASRAGICPDAISTDMTCPGPTFRVFDLPTVVSKSRMLAMPLPEAIASVTSHAAATVAPFQDLGTLRPGARADVAILELREGEFELVDNVDAKRTAHQKLVTSAGVVSGRRV